MLLSVAVYFNGKKTSSTKNFLLNVLHESSNCSLDNVTLDIRVMCSSVLCKCFVSDISNYLILSKVNTRMTVESSLNSLVAFGDQFFNGSMTNMTFETKFT